MRSGSVALPVPRPRSAVADRLDAVRPNRSIPPAPVIPILAYPDVRAGTIADIDPASWGGILVERGSNGAA